MADNTPERGSKTLRKPYCTDRLGYTPGEERQRTKEKKKKKNRRKEETKEEKMVIQNESPWGPKSTVELGGFVCGSSVIRLSRGFADAAPVILWARNIDQVKTLIIMIYY